MPKQSTANHSQNMPLCGCPDIYPCLVSWPTSGYYVHSRKALGLGTRSGDEWWCGRAFTTTRRIHVKSISPDQKKNKTKTRNTNIYKPVLYIFTISYWHTLWNTNQKQKFASTGDVHDSTLTMFCASSGQQTSLRSNMASAKSLRWVSFYSGESSPE